MFNKNWIWIAALAFVCCACSDDSSGGSAGGDNGGEQDKVKAGEGESCGGDTECISPFVCTNGVCTKKQEEKTDNSCTTDESCGNGKKCDNSVCKTIARPGKACDDTVYCKDSTCEDGFCRSYVGEGAECDAIYTLCETGLDCSSYGKCYRARDLGESCDEVEQFCASGYDCSLKQSVCVKPAGYGEDCGEDIFAECNLMDSYECIEANAVAILSTKSAMN